MDKEHAFLNSYNERWQRRNFSRVLAAMMGMIVLLMFITSVQAQEKYSAQIVVDVSYGNKPLEDAVYSYFARELRSLKDVEVVEKSIAGSFALHIVIVDVAVAGRRWGYALSYAITQNTRCNTKYRNPTDGTEVALFFDDYRTSGVYTADTSGLQSVAQEIVAAMDGRVLEEDRRNYKLIHSTH